MKTKRILLNGLILSFLILVVSCRTNSSDYNPARGDDLDETVTINFSVTEPALSEQYSSGDHINIRWSTDIGNPMVDIILYKKGAKLLVIAENTFFENAGYSWKVPDGISNSRHYRILVQNHAKPIEHGYSDYFYILD